MNPLVSIILVNYNGYEDTVECVRSLKEIDYDNYEVIVVDNGSTTSPTDLQTSYLSDNTCFIRNKENLGFAGGNNVGIRMALTHNPQYLLLLNNDTVVKKDFLSQLVEIAESRSDVGIVCGKIYWFDEPDILWYDGGAINRETCITTHYNYNKIDNHKKNLEIKEITFATGCMWLIPIQAQKIVGYLSEKYFLYAEDDDYCCRIIDAGLKIYYNPASVIYHKVSRSTGAMSTNTQYYTARNQLMIIHKFSTNKPKAYYCYLKRYVKKFLQKSVDLKVICEAVMAALRGKQGRRYM